MSDVVFDHKKLGPDSSVHGMIKCDFCNDYPIKGRRYNCLNCINKDFCESCWEDIVEFHEGHDWNCMIRVQDKTQGEKFCNGCYLFPIKTKVFKCEGCYGFVYCEGCHTRNLGLHNHKFSESSA